MSEDQMDHVPKITIGGPSPTDKILEHLDREILGKENRNMARETKATLLERLCELEATLEKKEASLREQEKLSEDRGMTIATLKVDIQKLEQIVMDKDMKLQQGRRAIIQFLKVKYNANLVGKQDWVDGYYREVEETTEEMRFLRHLHDLLGV